MQRKIYHDSRTAFRGILMDYVGKPKSVDAVSIEYQCDTCHRTITQHNVFEKAEPVLFCWAEIFDSYRKCNGKLMIIQPPLFREHHVAG